MSDEEDGKTVHRALRILGSSMAGIGYLVITGDTGWTGFLGAVGSGVLAGVCLTYIEVLVAIVSNARARGRGE